MSGHAALVPGVGVDEAVDLIVVGRGGNVVTVLAVVEVSLFAKPQAFVMKGVLVLRAIFMLGNS